MIFPLMMVDYSEISRREECYRMLAMLHEKTGRMDEAVRYYKMAIKESCGRTTGKAS